MHVTVATDARLFRGPDGVVRSPTDGRAYGFWTRYLEIFDSVRVLARVAPSTLEEGQRVEGAGVLVHPVPDFKGLWGLARRRRPVRDAISNVCEARNSAYIARVPSVVGGLMISRLRRRRCPHALEVVGDPFESMKTSSLPSVVASPLAHLGRIQLRRHCNRADAVSYVTGEVLQGLYPAGPGVVTSSYSSVELPDAAFQPRARDRVWGNPPVLVLVATMSQPYKGHDVAIRAISDISSVNCPVHLRFVGDGRLRPKLQRLAETLGVAAKIDFVGQLATPEAVQQELDRSDVFVLPSRTEGLPRALIEAMARGLPCVASRVGGVPELLDDRDLVAPGNPGLLADRLVAVLGDPAEQVAMSQRNYEVAQKYRSAALTEHRNRFYGLVRDACRTESSDRLDSGDRID